MAHDQKAEQILSRVFGRAEIKVGDRQFLHTAAKRKQGAELQGALEFRRAEQQGQFGTPQLASTNPQASAGTTNLAGAADQVISGSKAVRQGFSDLEQEKQKVKQAQSQLITEQEQFRVRQSLLQDPEFQDFIKFKADLAAGVQTQETGTEIIPGITDPLTSAQIATEERGELARRTSLAGDVISTREKFIGQQVEGIAGLKQQDLDIAQQNFDNARSVFQDALSFSESERADQAQNIDLFGLTANQRANLSVDLINQGFDSADVNEVLDRFSGSLTTGASGMRTDRHNNPAAFTTDIAKQAGLVLGVDYEIGDPFPKNPNLNTARLLGDPVETTIRVIDKIGFKTQGGANRWVYTDSIQGANNREWSGLSQDQKKEVIAQMYQREGGNGSLITGAEVEGAPGDPIEARRQANLAAKEKQKPPTDSQTKAATFLSRAANSDKIITENEKTLKNISAFSLSAQLKLPNFLKSDLIQSEEQARRDFTNAVLRRESGAVINEQEFENADQQYFVQPGDNESTIIQKQRNRALVLQGFQQETGSAFIPPDTSGEDIESVKSKFNVSY